MFNLKAQHALLELSTVAVGFDPGIVNFKFLSTDKSVIQMYQSSLAADEVSVFTSY